MLLVKLHWWIGVNTDIRFILRLGIVAVPVISIGAAYILIKRKYIIDERKYEELVEEIKSTNKK